jgi:uncharacterized membrane protein
MSLRRKTYVLLAARVVFNACGDVTLSRGMNHIGPVSIGSPSLIAKALLHIISSATIWLGIAFLLAFFVCHLLLYSWADYSYVMPTSAANFVAVPLIVLLLFNEPISFTRWVGIVIIFMGVTVVGLTHPVTRGAA